MSSPTIPQRATKSAYLTPRYRSTSGAHASPVHSAASQDILAQVATSAALPRPYNRHLFVELCRSADALVAISVFGSIFVLENAGSMPDGLSEFLLLRLSLLNLLTLGVFGYAWQLVFLLFGLYDRTESRSVRAEAPTVAAACTVGSLLALLPILWTSSGAYRATVVLGAWPFTILATLVVRALLGIVAEDAEEGTTRRVVIIGSGPLAVDAYEQLSGEGTSCQVLGFVDTIDEVASPVVGARMLGTLDDLESILMHTVVDEVRIALPVRSHYAEIERAIEECERAGVESRYRPDLFHSRLAKPRLETNGQPAVSMKVVSDDYRLVTKRAIDIVASALALLLLSPLFVVVALGIWITNPGPVFFGQERYGWRKRRFKMFKFRTMVTNAESLQGELESRNEAAGPVFKIRDDPRVTRFGRFLRRTSIDELPQLWNVLRGDMSLVGPRPLPTRDVHRFTEAALMRRFSVVPGITCLWQVDGRSDIGFDRWVQLDLQYIDRWSLLLDFTILARTVPAVLRSKGAC